MRTPAPNTRKTLILPALSLAAYSAMLAAAPIGTASAQSANDSETTGDSAMQHRESHADMAADTIEQRIASLHESLKITPAEETDWKAVAQTMRDNADAMQKLATEKKSQATSMTAVQDLQTYAAFAQAHVDHLTKLTSAFTTLYNTMPEQQKKLADEVFARSHHDEQGAEQHKQG